MFSFISGLNNYIMPDYLDESDVEVVIDEDFTYEMPEDSSSRSCSSDDEEADVDVEGMKVKLDDGAGSCTWSKTRTRKVKRNRSGDSALHSQHDFDVSNLNEYVKEYIDDDLINLIVEKSNQSSMERNGKSLNLSIKECKTFIGITLLMSCINYPNVRMYWNRKYAFPIITEAMSRTRFLQLRNSLKLVNDQDITPQMRLNDKLWKVRPMIDQVLQGCQTQKRHQEISIGEIIIPFTGTCAIRQYCPGKLHSTGLNTFILANPNGLVCDILVHQGKSTLPTSEFSLKERVVLKLSENLVPGNIIHCDPSFTSSKLTDELNVKGIKCAETIAKRQNSKYLKDDLETEKCSPGGGKQSLDGDKSKMWGVALTEKLLAVCSARIRTDKWTVRFIEHMLDLAIVNSWIRYNEDKTMKRPAQKNLKLWEFKQEIAEKMIIDNTYKNTELDENGIEEVDQTRKRGKSCIIPLPPMAKRLHAANHLPDMSTKQMRCRYDGCRRKTTVACINCNIHLCLTANRNCFKEFHSAPV